MSDEMPVEQPVAPLKGSLLSNRAYDVLKFVTTIALPGVGALYFALAEIWGLPKAQEVVGTITAVVVFLGLLLGLSTKSYNNSDTKYDGALVEETGPDDKKIITFITNKEDPREIVNQKEALFKVVTKPREE